MLRRLLLVILFLEALAVGAANAQAVRLEREQCATEIRELEKLAADPASGVSPALISVRADVVAFVAALREAAPGLFPNDAHVYRVEVFRSPTNGAAVFIMVYSTHCVGVLAPLPVFDELYEKALGRRV